MKRNLFLLVIIVFLITTTSVVLAKPGQSGELVCWKHKGTEQSAYFMKTGSGIVHRFKEDGRHDIYKPASKFDLPFEGEPWESEPGERGWTLWEAKEHDACEQETPATYAHYLEPGEFYWHKYK